MDDKFLISQEIQIQDSKSTHPEVEALMGRLMELEPKEMADALYHLETLKEFPHILSRTPQTQKEETKLYFSQGLKHEMETIYLELAKHLRTQSGGAVDLMNAVFDFFSKTLKALPEVPHLFSMN